MPPLSEQDRQAIREYTRRRGNGVMTPAPGIPGYTTPPLGSQPFHWQLLRAEVQEIDRRLLMVQHGVDNIDARLSALERTPALPQDRPRGPFFLPNERGAR